MVLKAQNLLQYRNTSAINIFSEKSDKISSLWQLHYLLLFTIVIILSLHNAKEDREFVLGLLRFKTIYVTSFSVFHTEVNNEYWSQKWTQNGNIHSTELHVYGEKQSASNLSIFYVMESLVWAGPFACLIMLSVFVDKARLQSSPPNSNT